jgi:hypothetical protein
MPQRGVGLPRAAGGGGRQTGGSMGADSSAPLTGTSLKSFFKTYSSNNEAAQVTSLTQEYQWETT